MINDKDSGTIFLDPHDVKKSIPLILKLSKDDVMRDEYRNMAFEYHKNHQDSDVVFNNITKEFN